MSWFSVLSSVVINLYCTNHLGTWRLLFCLLSPEEKRKVASWAAVNVHIYMVQCDGFFLFLSSQQHDIVERYLNCHLQLLPKYFSSVLPLAFKFLIFNIDYSYLTKIPSVCPYWILFCLGHLCNFQDNFNYSLVLETPLCPFTFAGILQG